jgi:Cell division protein CrgA
VGSLSGRPCRPAAALGYRVPQRCPPDEEMTMPKSKVRKKSGYTPQDEAMGPAKVPVAGPSHPLYVGVMLGLMLLGLLMTMRWR